MASHSIHDKKTNKEPPLYPGHLLSAPDDEPCLDTTELDQLEQAFHGWSEDSPREDVRFSRKRILLVFLLIRYTGAKLSEVLALNPFEDIDYQSHTVRFKSPESGNPSQGRQVDISETLSQRIRAALADPAFRRSLDKRFDVDPGFVRRKFYERAQSCGFPKHLGGPEMLRRARAVELMKNSLPLPAVQMMLGHSTPNLTSSYVSFSPEEIHRITRLFMDRELSRKTSARNSFFGKVRRIQKGDIQAQVDLVTPGGYSVSTVITNDSLLRLGLKEGSLLTAEIKAPFVILQKGDKKPRCSADNIFKGEISRINRGTVNTEYAARIEDGTEICSIVATDGLNRLDLNVGDPVWVLFNCFSVILHVD